MYSLKCGAWLTWRCKILSSRYLRTIRWRRSPGNERRAQRDDVHGVYSLGFGTASLSGRTLHPEVKNRILTGEPAWLHPCHQGFSQTRKPMVWDEVVLLFLRTPVSTVGERLPLVAAEERKERD